MADLRNDFIGIKSPNPFWLASAPPTDKEYNVRRAFEAGWGGVVWKTLGFDPHIVNVNGPRYGAVWGDSVAADEWRSSATPPTFCPESETASRSARRSPYK